VAARRAAAEVRETLGGLDTVVWSAGYWKHMDPSAWDLETFSRHVDVNLMGMGNVLAATLPGLVEQRHGHVVGVASVAGYRGLPGAEAYGATKAAQILLLESLRGSLSPFGVRVTTVCPGFVRTEMTEVNEFPMPFIVDPEAAGREIVDGIERGAAEVVFPWQMALLMKAARLLPARAWGCPDCRHRCQESLGGWGVTAVRIRCGCSPSSPSRGSAPPGPAARESTVVQRRSSSTAGSTFREPTQAALRVHLPSWVPALMAGLGRARGGESASADATVREPEHLSPSDSAVGPQPARGIG
jgi:hypothetical protein